MDKNELLSILHQAMEMELTGEEFYRMTADHTEDEQGKATFRQLAREEVEHFEVLRKAYEALEHGQLAIWDVGAQPRPNLDAVFSPELRARAKGLNFEISALSIGVMLEKNTFQFYGRAAERAGGEEAEGMFRHLEEWEKGHYRRLLASMEMLKEESWAQNRFAPF